LKKNDPGQTSSGKESDLAPSPSKKRKMDKEMQTVNDSTPEGSFHKFMAKNDETMCTVEVKGVLIVYPKSKHASVTAYKYLMNKYIKGDEHIWDAIKRKRNEDYIKVEPIKEEAEVVEPIKEEAEVVITMETDEAAKDNNQVEPQDVNPIEPQGDDDDVVFVSEIKDGIKAEPISPSKEKWANGYFVRVLNPNRNAKQMCIFCREVFEDITEVKKHIQENHDEKKKKRFKTPENILNFKKINIEKCENGNWKCKICQDDFETRIAAKQHVMVNTVCKLFFKSSNLNF
jgi:hypothetical protein